MAKNDKITIPLQDEGLNSLSKAQTKVFWVCNAAYPEPLNSVYRFLEHVYDISVPATKRSKVVELIAKLQAVH